MRSRKSEGGGRLGSSVPRSEYFSTSRRKSPLLGRVSPRCELLPISLIYAPYSLSVRARVTLKHRKASESRHRPATPQGLPPPLALRSPKRISHHSPPSAVRHKLRSKTPTPQSFSLRKRTKVLGKIADEPVIRIQKDELRISMENVLQTPGEDQPTNTSGSIYDPEIKKSLEEYLQQHTIAEQAIVVLPTVKAESSRLPSTESGALTTDSGSQGPEQSLDLKDLFHAHRRLLLSDSSSRNHLTPPPRYSAHRLLRDL